MIAEGTPAPDFTLQDQFGREISLSDFRDRQHVLLSRRYPPGAGRREL